MSCTVTVGWSNDYGWFVVNAGPWAADSDLEIGFASLDDLIASIREKLPDASFFVHVPRRLSRVRQLMKVAKRVVERRRRESANGKTRDP